MVGRHLDAGDEERAKLMCAGVGAQSSLELLFKTPWLVAIVAMIANTAPACAAELAPLPDGFRSEPASTVPGLYAQGVDYHNRNELEKSLRAADSACLARGRKLEHFGDANQGTNTRYWLYRNDNETVVFKSSHTVEIDVDLCRVNFIEKREVTRSLDKAGAWPVPFLGGRGCSRFGKNCYTAKKFGIEERCHAEGNGFQVTRYCVSIDRGRSRGLLLESAYESDDMSGSGFYITELKVDASLDASLFDRSIAW